MRPRVKPAVSWVARTKYELEHADELLLINLMLLKVIRWTKDTQELWQRLRT
jgi:hypothetical protein